MSLHCWCYLLGTIATLCGVGALIKPNPFSKAANAMPRNNLAGWILSTIAWTWGGYALWQMGLDILMPYQKFIPFAILVCIPLTWFWLDNLLACRSLGAILMLFPYELLHIARVHPSAWRLVPVSLAYISIIAGMTFMLHPWRLRQLIVWATAQPTRFRTINIVKLLLGIILITLATTTLTPPLSH